MTTPNTPMTEQMRADAFVTLLDQVAAAELKGLSLPKCHAHAICAAFWGNVRSEILAQMADLEIHRHKQSGGPAKDNQDRAVKLELQWSEAARLGGMLS
ncbi:hypothetical protein [Polaromonas sp. YR568]|uniref:hypothetical protein n=1 Tax=Polaromonas sp. YR568 TaxID=1855301 RepID=UPI00313790E3